MWDNFRANGAIPFDPWVGREEESVGKSGKLELSKPGFADR
jgi:hypothetical protein